jgi:hypothetical protein
MKLDLLTNATVVDDAIRFVSSKSGERLKSSSSKESNENDYDEGQEDRLEEKQEEEITAGLATNNLIF